MTLGCHSPRAADVTLLEWIRSDLKKDYVFFFRENRVYKNYQHPSYHDRVELKDPQMKDGDFSVILKNVTVDEAGTYECYAVYGGSTELINSINLKVEEPGEFVSLGQS